MKKHLFNVGDNVVLKTTNMPVMKVDFINRNGTFRCVWQDLLGNPRAYNMDAAYIRLHGQETNKQSDREPGNFC